MNGAGGIDIHYVQSPCPFEGEPLSSDGARWRFKRLSIFENSKKSYAHKRVLALSADIKISYKDTIIHTCAYTYRDYTVYSIEVFGTSVA